MSPAPRHAWGSTPSQWNGQPVERCTRCVTERTKDPGTRSLYLYRRGHARPPSGKPLTDEWSAFRAGVVPACAQPEVTP